MKKYVITGATGKTGAKVAENLLAKGADVTIISRKVEHTLALQRMGARVATGSTNDLDFLKETLDGAHALFILIPVNTASKDHKSEQATHVEAFAAAIAATGIAHVVGISSIGVTLPEKRGIVSGLRVMEDALNAIPNLNTMFLRASYFMENTLALINGIRKFNVLVAPIAADLRFPVVATKDIANRAANFLHSLSFKGKNYENVLGPRMVTYPEMAAVYGASVGLPDLRYRQVSLEDFRNALTGVLGMSESTADHYVEFTHQMNQGLVYKGITAGTPEVTPTTIEEFAKSFAAAYHA